jgi:hypothetical protein
MIVATKARRHEEEKRRQKKIKGQSQNEFVGEQNGRINEMNIENLNLTGEDIEYAKKDDVWTFANNILYKMCKDHSQHKKADIVIAKIWIIGRTYAAAIERRKNNNTEKIENDAFYENTVVPKIINSDIDDWIGNIRHFGKIDNNSIPYILKTHSELVNLFQSMAGMNKRSLASKYLHFHLPKLFYIYDSQAIKGFRQIASRYRTSGTIEGSYDNDYELFVLKLFDLQEDIKEKYKETLTPRQIDRLLLRKSLKKK